MTDMDKIVQALEMARRVVEYDADCYAPEKLDAAICAVRSTRAAAMRSKPAKAPCATQSARWSATFSQTAHC